MAATSDKEMESVLLNFEQIYQEYKDTILEIQSLKSSCNAETKRREALEAISDNLKIDNERLRKSYTELLTKLANQFERHIMNESLKEELKQASDQLIRVKDEHARTLDFMKQKYEVKIQDLEKQVSCCLHQKLADEDSIGQLQQDLAVHQTQTESLTNCLKQDTADTELKYHHVIQDLKDWVMVEQEEKNHLHKKLQSAEDELLLMKRKQAEQQQESISIRHVETLKQKVMKLRKENESLKRQMVTRDSKNR